MSLMLKNALQARDGYLDTEPVACGFPDIASQSMKLQRNVPAACGSQATMMPTGSGSMAIANHNSEKII